MFDGIKETIGLECPHERTESTVNAGIERVVCLDCDNVEIERVSDTVTPGKTRNVFRGEAAQNT